jgi:glycine/D-amino acid oxidase-like deaminating enzyme
VASAAIIGAGTFGSSLAWWLARTGWDVTLVDQFEPGDTRATSGGETRLIRCGHGEDALYPASAWRARSLWRELEAECGEELLEECGLAWFAHREDGWEGASARVLAEAGIPCERLDPGEGARLFPNLRTDDLAFVLLEPHAGVLRAQQAVRALASAAVDHGARLVRSRARPSSSCASRGRSCSSSTAARSGGARRAGSTSTAPCMARATSTTSVSRPRTIPTARRSTLTTRCPPPTRRANASCARWPPGASRRSRVRP